MYTCIHASMYINTHASMYINTHYSLTKYVWIMKFHASYVNVQLISCTIKVCLKYIVQYYDQEDYFCGAESEVH